MRRGHLLLGAKQPAASPLSYSYIDNGDLRNLTPAVTKTFSGVSLGAAASDRTIVIVGGGADADARTLLSVTVGGVTASVDVAVTIAAGTDKFAFVAHAAVPTGTTGDVVVTWSGLVAMTYITVYRVVGVVYVTDTDAYAANNVTPYSVSLTTASGGVAFATVVWGNNATTTWTTLAKDYQYGGANACSAASVATTGVGVSATATCSDTPNASVICAVAYAPA